MHISHHRILPANTDDRDGLITASGNVMIFVPYSGRVLISHFDMGNALYHSCNLSTHFGVAIGKNLKEPSSANR